MIANKSSNRIEELDALRGIAALMVVLFHYNLMLGQNATDIFKFGVTGVDLFFIISGFVIFMSISKINNGVDFVINRISRLYPAYWVCVSITFLVLTAYHQVINQEKIVQYLANLTMFQFYFRVENIDASYWTMIIEMIFYIGILLLFKKKLLKHLNTIGVCLCIAVALSANFAYQIGILSRLIRYIPFLQFVPLFFAGTLFYKIHKGEQQSYKSYIILLLCLIAQISLFSYSGASRFYISQIQYGIILSIYFFLSFLFVNGKLGFIVSKTTLFLGNISFSLYLIHQALSTDVIIPFLTQKLHLNFWIASLLITLPFIIFLAAMITYYIEKPLSRKMKEKLRSLKSSKTVPNLSV